MNDESDCKSSYDDEDDTGSYDELFIHINDAIRCYGLSISDIENALFTYLDWFEITGIAELNQILFDKDAQPILPSDIIYYQQIEKIYTSDENYDE